MEQTTQNRTAKVLGFIVVILLILLLVKCTADPKEYTVTFDTDGGNVIEPIKVQPGDLIGRPADPVKEGYTFAYWEYNDEEFDFTTPINSNLTLKAIYGGTDLFMVTLDYGDRTEEVAVVGGLLEKPADPEREGYTFVYWEWNGEEFDFSQPIEENLTLVAKWEAKTMTIKFDAGDGSPITEQTVLYGDRLIKPTDPVREGFEFDGWYFINQEFDFSQPIEREVTLVARWVEIEEEPTDPETSTPEPTVNKNRLRNKIAEAKNYKATDYTDASFNALTSAIRQAEAVYNNANATQAQVDAQVTSLNNAISKLVKKPGTPTVDKSKLQTAINLAKTKKEADYTDASFKAMQEALNAAEAVNKNSNATQAQVDAQVSKLNKAINNLKAKEVVVDKSALQKKLADAKAYKAADYTDSTFSALQNAIKAAQAVYDKKNATQAQVNAQVSTLQKAIDGLEKKVVVQPVYRIGYYRPADMAQSPAVVVTVTKDGVTINNAVAVYDGDVLLGDTDNDLKRLVVDGSEFKNINRIKLSNGTFVNVTK